MPTFSGFPARTLHTPVPNAFFGPLLESIQDPGELRCALRALFLLHRKRGYPRFLTFSELAADPTALRVAAPGRTQEGLRKALDACQRDGILLRLAVTAGDRQEELYLLNTAENRQAAERIQRGEIALPGLPNAAPLEEAPPRRDIFQLYEENIGMITPLVGEQLKDAEGQYPASWIEEAIREAALRNKRSWPYIERILQRWASEGREGGEPGRHPERVPAKELLRGRRRYGPLAR
ncbi:MAG: DnaD domain protein [Chloroflexi bacterium]|nr:DnaD domain protein [Chloroflexota bacterium]